MQAPFPKDQPALTDRDSLNLRRARALRRSPDDFLHRIVADEIDDRLAAVNRRFTSEAVVTGLPDLWRGYRPQARVVADDPVLDLTPGAHDLVIHAMALHWADDPVGQIVQCVRALRPDGLFIAALPGGETLAELRAALAEAEVAETGGLSPRVLPMGEIRNLGGLLGRAGLALPVADQMHVPASYSSLTDLAHDLRGMGETNAMAARLRRATPRAVLARADAALHQNFPDPDDPGRFRTAYDLIFLTGWSPDDSQQKPLRPGSAQMRLADALNADRTKL